MVRGEGCLKQKKQIDPKYEGKEVCSKCTQHWHICLAGSWKYMPGNKTSIYLIEGFKIVNTKVWAVFYLSNRKLFVFLSAAVV